MWYSLSSDFALICLIDKLKMIPWSPDVRTPLPFGLTIYVIRTLIYPTIIFDQAIDIIRLLAHVEEIRLHAGNRARAVLEWNERVLQAQHNGDPEWMDVRAIEKGSKVESNLQTVARNLRGQGNIYLTYRRLVAGWQVSVCLIYGVVVPQTLWLIA